MLERCTEKEFSAAGTPLPRAAQPNRTDRSGRAWGGVGRTGPISHNICLGRWLAFLNGTLKFLKIITDISEKYLGKYYTLLEIPNKCIKKKNMWTAPRTARMSLHLPLSLPVVVWPPSGHCAQAVWQSWTPTGPLGLYLFLDMKDLGSKGNFHHLK